MGSLGTGEVICTNAKGDHKWQEQREEDQALRSSQMGEKLWSRLHRRETLKEEDVV